MYAEHKHLPGNFALVHIHSSFTEETCTSLRLLAAVRAEEVDVWGFIRHFKVPDGAVPL